VKCLIGASLVVFVLIDWLVSWLCLKVIGAAMLRWRTWQVLSSMDALLLLRSLMIALIGCRAGRLYTFIYCVVALVLLDLTCWLSIHVTFVDILQIFAWNFKQQLNIYFTTKFYLIISENGNIILFEPRQPSFPSIRASSCRTGCKRTVLGSLKSYLLGNWSA